MQLHLIQRTRRSESSQFEPTLGTQTGGASLWRAEALLRNFLKGPHNHNLVSGPVYFTLLGNDSASLPVSAEVMSESGYGEKSEFIHFVMQAPPAAIAVASGFEIGQEPRVEHTDVEYIGLPFGAATISIIPPPRPSSSSPLPKAIEYRLAELASLPEGWDSYGATRVTNAAGERARKILSLAIADPLRLPEPFIAPMSSGGLSLEWHMVSGKELILDISPDGEVSYLFVSPRPTDGGEEELEKTVGAIDELVSILRSLQD